MILIEKQTELLLIIIHLFISLIILYYLMRMRKSGQQKKVKKSGCLQCNEIKLNYWIHRLSHNPSRIVFYIVKRHQRAIKRMRIRKENN